MAITLQDFENQIELLNTKYKKIIDSVMGDSIQDFDSLKPINEELEELSTWYISLKQQKLETDLSITEQLKIDIELKIEELNNTLDNESQRVETFNASESQRTETFNTNETQRDQTITDKLTQLDNTFSESESQRTETFNTNETQRDQTIIDKLTLLEDTFSQSEIQRDDLISQKLATLTNGTDGTDGKSAYQTWQDLGNTGTEQDFIDYITATDGIDGIDGIDGKSAYQTWQDLGNSGTEQDFIDYIAANDGTDGTDGKSAYQSALDNDFQGTEEEWLASLKQNNDLTLLADFQTLKNSGNITLSESIENFDLLVFIISHTEGGYITSSFFPVEFLHFEQSYILNQYDTMYLGFEFFTNSEIKILNGSAWLRKIIGLGRK